jgi:hypothetical protein
MSDVPRILSAIEAGDLHAAEELLPLVYDEPCKLAAARMAQESPGQTLQATALAHEAYLRLVGGNGNQRWNSRGHFSASPQKPCGAFWLRARGGNTDLRLVVDIAGWN